MAFKEMQTPAEKDGKGSWYLMWLENGEWKIWCQPLSEDLAQATLDSMLENGVQAYMFQETADFDHNGLSSWNGIP